MVQSSAFSATPRETERRQRRVWPRSVLLACLLLLGTWTLAWAHATLVSAEPAKDAKLTASPPRVRLVFSEPLEPALAHVTLVAAGGASTKLPVAGDPHDVHAIVAPLAPLSAGAYRVVWHVVSADGHPVDGSYTFTLEGTTPAAAESAAAAPPPPAVADTTSTWGPTLADAPVVPAVLRGVSVGALMALVGLLGFLAWAGGAPEPRGAARLASTLALLTPVLLALYLAAWLVNASPDHRLTSDWVTSALGSGVGRVELWRLGLAVLVPWALLLARRRALAAVVALGALAVGGASGHSAAIDPMWAIPAKAVHLVAAGAWLGGLLWLLAAARGAETTFARQAARVSSVALGAVLLVVVTGVAQTLFFLPSPLDLVRSAYGAVAIAKIVGLLGLVGFGAYHRYRVLPRLPADAAGRLASSLRGEVALFAVVVLLGGLLAFVPPPARPALTPTTASDAH
jgi:copper transport protein